MGVRPNTINFGTFVRSGDTQFASYPAGTIALLQFLPSTVGIRPQMIVANLINRANFKVRAYIHAGSDLSTLYQTGNRVNFLSLQPTKGSVSYLDVAPNGAGKFHIDTFTTQSGSLDSYLAVILTDAAGTGLTGFAGQMELVHFEGRYTLRYP